MSWWVFFKPVSIKLIYQHHFPKSVLLKFKSIQEEWRVEEIAPNEALEIELMVTFSKEILEEKAWNEKATKKEWVVLRIAIEEARKITSLIATLGRMLLLQKFWALCKWILENERRLIKEKWKWI